MSGCAWVRLHDQLSLQLVVCAANRQSSLQIHARMHGVGEGVVPCGTAVGADSVWGACGHPCERLGPGGANPDRSGREQVTQHLDRGADEATEQFKHHCWSITKFEGKFGSISPSR